MPPRKPSKPSRGDRRGDASDQSRHPQHGKKRQLRAAGRETAGHDDQARHPRRAAEPAGARVRQDPDRSVEAKLPNEPISAPGKDGYWIFGHHAVAAALANPRRQVHRLLVADEGDAAIGRVRKQPEMEAVERALLDRMLGRDAVHQGIAARVSPLPDVDIYEICDLGRARETACVVILDQVTDPHNVGAILRSAAAFGALALILTERHAAPESGVLAKAASGALEHVPLVRVTNLARAMEELKTAGFWCIGLAAEGRQTLASVKPGGRVVLCLGAEGVGLRRLTRDHCDLLVRLPTSGPIDHLNVSNAAAVSLYELVRANPHDKD